MGDANDLLAGTSGAGVNPVVGQLIGRSNRLGADPRNTNYAGGNTSAKGIVTDPVTREQA
jgi:rhamnose utilization protein RhaD (predicted bifunctional aldolase and dehydrogenase)